MYNGKHAKKTTFKSKKTLTLLVALLVIFTVSVGSTLAFLITQTDSVVNTFTPGKIKGDVIETFDGETKKDVKISIDSDSDVSAYVRAAIVVSWKTDKNENGNRDVYGKKPTEDDYSMILNLDDGWFDGKDGYYYYATPIGASEKEENNVTTNLIDSCTQLQACENPKYKLNVDVIAEAIQAEPVDAVKEAWSVTVNSNGTISK